MKVGNPPYQNMQSSEAKLDNVHFTITWEIQLTSPVIGLSFGHLFGLQNQHPSTKLKDTEKIPQVSEKKLTISSCPTGNVEGKVNLADQLAVVTTKSFHLFSLCFSIPPVLES